MLISFDRHHQAKLSRYRNTLHSILRSRCFSKAEREDFLTEFETAARAGAWTRAQYVLSLAAEFSRASVSDEIDLLHRDPGISTAARVR